MGKYTNSNKNSNRKNIFERISKFSKVKNELTYRINKLEEKIENLSIQSSSEFNKKDFSVSNYANLQTQINSYKKELDRYYDRLNKLNPIAKNLKKVCIKIGATIAASAIAIGGFAAIIKHNSKNNAPSEPTTSYSEETKESTTQDPYSHLNTPDAILKDFKQRFIEKYNEEHGTSISANSISLRSSPTKFIFKTHDGQYVTHGAYIYETEKVLATYGDYEKIGIASEYSDSIMQVTMDGKAIESYIDTRTCDKFENYDSLKSTILSGNDLDSLLEKLQKKEGLSTSTLEEFHSLANCALKASSPYSNSREWINEYKNLVKELDHKKDNPTVSTIQEEISEINYDKLVETVAPKFIDLYAKPNRTPAEQKQLENYAAEIIEKTDYLESQLFERLNKQELERLNSDEDEHNKIDEIISVDAYLFNYTSGSYNPVVSYNSKEPVFSHNDGTILATSVINKKYSDNIALANARLAAYALQSMDSNVIKEVCIVKDSNNRSEYNFNFADNIKFRAAAKQVFKNNIQLYEAEFIMD